MRSSLRTFCYVVALVVLGSTSSVAQGSRAPVSRATWLTLALGLGSAPTDVAVVGLAEVSHQAGVAVLSLSAVTSSADVAAVGILAGVGTPPRVGHVSVEVGLARVSGGPAAVIGVPVQVQADVRTRVIGIGILGYANLNSYRSFTAVAIALQVGRLW